MSLIRLITPPSPHVDRQSQAPLWPFARGMAAFFFMLMASLCVLGGCASQGVPSTKAVDITAEPAPGFFMPPKVFDLPKGKPATAIPKNYVNFSSPDAPKPFLQQVVLYVSRTTQSYVAQGGLDPSYGPQVWEVFLKKYKIPYQIASTLGQLEASSSGVLLLPSTVALSSRERQAIVNFRARGGSVLATWLCGVRDENGAWLGFDFMENTLDAKVVGDTSADKDDSFLMPNGDSPVSNALPAGQRVWLERVKGWFPLRLSGRFGAAHMMDWSRTFNADKETTVLVFDERPLPLNRASRSVVLGYPERLWQSANPEYLEAINYNVISWLLRLPSAYKPAWPAPYSSAMALAIDAAEVVAFPDMAFAGLLEEIGGRATYYSVSEHASKSAKNLTELQNRGHELAYMGDTFNGFKGQAATTQADRFEKMRQRFKAAGLVVPENPGFHAPTESYDKTTENLLVQTGYGHYISFMDATDSRLPFIASPTSQGRSAAPATIVLPRTQRGPEDATEEGDVDDGLKSFFSELTLAQNMAGLSVVRMPTQSILPIEDWTKVIDDFKTRKDRMWIATGSQIAQWWRERERVAASIQGTVNASELRVDIQGETPLKENVVVWVNLPVSGGTLSLTSAEKSAESLARNPLPKIVTIDKWRAGVLLANLKPGTYRWKLQFKD
jgi:Polysaccharide deacetylase